MRLSASEKREIIRLVEGSEPGVNKMLRELGIHKSTFYKWYRAYLDKGACGLDLERKPAGSGTPFPISKNNWWWK